MNEKKIGVRGNLWLVSFKIRYVWLGLFYERGRSGWWDGWGCGYREV